MKLEDLWIGDWVELRDTKLQGKYEGVGNNGGLLVKIGDKHITTTLENIILIDEPEPTIEPGNPPMDSQRDIIENFESTIDLHMENLAPGMKFSAPSRILAYQIDACRNFIVDALQRKIKIIHIIHGKGEGVLKNEIKHLLGEFEQVKFSISTNDGGSLEVWFKD